MVQTTWYRIIGNGGVISINTAGSNFDTVIAAYFAPTPTSTDPLPCSNNVSAGDVTSAISFQSELGRTYLIQVGGCWFSGSACGFTSGFLRMAITFGAPPAPPAPPPVVVTPPPPPDADGDGVPEDGRDKCPGSRPTRDENLDGCQDAPKRIRADLGTTSASIAGAAVARGIALKRVSLGDPKGARVRVSCTRCLKAARAGASGRSAVHVHGARAGMQGMRGLNGVRLPRRRRRSP